MTFGVFLLAGRFPGQSDADALGRAVAVGMAAERVGLHDAWVAEHHFMPYGVCPDGITFSSYLLGRTTALRVGTAVTVLSTQHPVAVGERARLLAAMTGRFHLGVGRGSALVELEVFGTGLGRYETGFSDSLDLLTNTVLRDSVAGNPAFPFREVPLVPAGSVTVHVACTSEATVDLAAARGLPMLLGMHIGDAAKREMVEHYRRVGGPADADHISTVVAHVSGSRGQAVDEVMATAPGWLREGFAAHVTVDGRPGPGRDPEEYARHLCDLHPIGDPEYCREVIAASREATGIDHVIALPDPTGRVGHAVDTVRRLAVEVLPALPTPPGSDLGKLA